MADLATTLNKLQELGVGFVSLTEALDFTTPSGRAMAGLLVVFADYERELIRERVKAGIAHARANGKPHGRPARAREKAASVRELAAEGLSQCEIARRLMIHRRHLVIEVRRSNGGYWIHGDPQENPNLSCLSGSPV
jgi:DNA invertase Pin-like site-specific DNA recombinase